MRTLRVAIILSLLAIFATYCGPLPDNITIGFGEPTQDVKQIVQATFQAMTVQAVSQTLTPTAAPTVPSATAAPVPGSISGALSYPSEFIPPLRVVAFRVDGRLYRYVDTMQNQGAYQITGLPPGTYHVIAYAGSTFAGGYTAMVPCGLSVDCTDHTLLNVTVTSGQDTPNIDPGDWYAPEGTFAPMP